MPPCSRLIIRGLLIALFANLPAYVEALADEAPRRTLSVIASGSVMSAPDQVAILTGVAAEGASPSEALAKSSAAMSRVIEALRRNGIAPKDIQTTNFSLQPLYEQKDHPTMPQVIGYRANNSARIVLHDMAKLGLILDKVVSLGANDIGGIEFGLADPEASEGRGAQARLYQRARQGQTLCRGGGRRARPHPFHQRGGDQLRAARPVGDHGDGEAGADRGGLYHGYGASASELGD